MGKEEERIKQEMTNKVMKKTIDERKKKLNEVSEALATLYVAGLRDRLVVDLVHEMLTDMKENKVGPKESAKNQNK